MKVRDLLARLAGHDPKSLDGHGHDDRQPITQTGWSVVPPLIVTSLNWAGAGVALSLGSGWIAAIIAGLILGAIGFVVVAIFDRAALYHMDTQSNGVLSKLGLVGIRMMIILLISSVTAQAIAPLLMRSELTQEALRIREQSQEQRTQRLVTQHDLPGHQVAVDRADADVEKVKRALAIVPQDIQQRLDAARRCWAGHNRRRDQLRAQGLSDPAVRRALASTSARCSSSMSSAQRDLEAYRQKSRAALAGAEQDAQGARLALSDSETSLKAKLEEAAEIERSAIGPQSAIVLDSLLKSNDEARYKWWRIYLLIVFAEVMALLLKLMAGMSVPGMRIAIDKQIAMERHARRRKAAAEEARIEEALRETMTAAMLTALSTSEVQNHAAQLFTGKVEALAPIEVFKALMREIEAGEVNVQSAIQRHPDIARVITEAWAKTIDEVVERLRPTKPNTWRSAA